VGSESPRLTAKDALGLRSVLADGRNLLRRSDVPAWCPGRIFVETKVVSNITLLRCKAIAAAHRAPVYQRHETIPRDLNGRKPKWRRGCSVNGMTFSFCSPIIEGMTGLNLGLPTAWVVKCKKCGCTINCRAIDPQ